MLSQRENRYDLLLCAITFTNIPVGGLYPLSILQGAVLDTQCKDSANVASMNVI